MKCLDVINHSMIDAMGEIVDVGIPGYRLLERYDMLKCVVATNAGFEAEESNE